MTDSAIVLVKLGVALLGAGALIWRARRTSEASRLSRRLLLDLGLFSALLWWNLLTLHSGNYVHTWETYHFYVGAKYFREPLTNNMGLKTVVGYEHASRARLSAPLGLETDPYQVWKEARRRTFAERRVIFAGLVTAFVVMLAWAVRNQTDWAAAILGIGLIPVATELTSYYYAVLLAFGFLWPKPASVGIGLCLLAAVTSVIPQLTGWNDEIHTAISGAVVVFVIGATIAVGASRPAPAASPASG